MMKERPRVYKADTQILNFKIKAIMQEGRQDENEEKQFPKISLKKIRK